jgi:hypothetical protein
MDYRETSRKFGDELVDLQRIIAEKGFSSETPKNFKWYKFIDMNDITIATKGNQSAMFVNLTTEEIQSLLGVEWELEHFENTGKFFYKKLQNKK